MVKLIIFGEFFGTSGFAKHTRNLANALHKVGVEVSIITSFPNSDWRLDVSDSEFLMLTRKFEPKDETYTLLIGSPPSFSKIKSISNSKKYGIFLVFEGDKIPKYWLKYLEEADFIFVPSKHVYKALTNTDVQEKIEREKISIVPHGVNFEDFEIKNIQNRPFTFGFFKGWRGGMNDRSGFQYLAKAYHEEFSKEDNVRLLAHFNPAYLPPNFDIEKELIKIGITPKDPTKAPILIHIDNGGGLNPIIDDKKISEFYGECDIYVCPTRAEGFNITGLEAKACGLSTIQTYYGGQTDYMTEDDFALDFVLEKQQDILYFGVNWAIPSIEHLRKLMREAYNRREELKNKKEKIRKEVINFSWTNSGKIIKTKLYGM